MAQGLYQLDKTVQQQIKLDYLLYLPQGYDPDDKWPLILFLHGAGERGDDLNKVQTQGLPKNLYYGRDIPFVVVSPQCPEDHTWDMHHSDLVALLEYVLETYPIDPDRVYLTGLSMGGYGTFHFAYRYPGYFAAIAPICGGMPWLVDVDRSAETLKDMPTWVFHGSVDSIVPISESQRMVDALKKADNSVKFTVYPDLDHDSWTVTYDNPELYDWFLNHERGNRA